MNQYNIPYIHLRGLFSKRQGVIDQNQLMQQEYSRNIGGRNYKMIEEVIEES